MECVYRRKLLEILQLLPKELDICRARPKQFQYMEAMLYANIDSLYQQDETMPTLRKDYQMRIHTTTETPMKTTRLQVFSGTEKDVSQS